MASNLSQARQDSNVSTSQDISIPDIRRLLVATSVDNRDESIRELAGGGSPQENAEQTPAQAQGSQYMQVGDDTHLWTANIGEPHKWSRILQSNDLMPYVHATLDGDGFGVASKGVITNVGDTATIHLTHAADGTVFIHHPEGSKALEQSVMGTKAGLGVADLDAFVTNTEIVDDRSQG